MQAILSDSGDSEHQLEGDGKAEESNGNASSRQERGRNEHNGKNYY